MIDNENAVISSKFWRTTLLIFSVLLIFAGPTYVPYLMSDIAGIDYFVSIGVGVVLLVVGLLLMLFLIRKKVIT
jgi:hypothetical protein